MQKARRRPKASTACKHMVSGSFSLPCLGYFSPFPHGTGSLSVSREYLALDDGPPRFRQGFTCPALLRIQISLNYCVYRIFTFFDGSFQTTSTSNLRNYICPTTPERPKPPWFGLFPFRSPLLRESLLIYFPPGTEMFQFSGLAFHLRGIYRLPHSEIYGSITYLRLSVAYRSLSRRVPL